MSRTIAVICGAACAALVGALVVCHSGIALTGPEQNFTIPQAGTMASYLRIWNEGDSTATITLTVTGSVSQLLSVPSPSLQLAAGESRIVGLTYSVPAGYPPGRYTGMVQAETAGTITASVTRSISVLVIEAAGARVSLGAGLNLVTWLGPDATFAAVFATDLGVSRVWMRTASGGYLSATYYAGSGWWSSDSSFTGLKCGQAYFIESSRACQVDVARANPAREIRLKTGLNLVGWTGANIPVGQGFPQTASYHPISKIWRRNPNGSYTAIQYFPQQAGWWSSDASFTSLETGSAYFVECEEAATFTV